MIGQDKIKNIILNEIEDAWVEEKIRSGNVDLVRIGERSICVCLTLNNKYDIVVTASAIELDAVGNEAGVRVCARKIIAKLMGIKAFLTIEDIFNG